MSRHAAYGPAVNVVEVKPGDRVLLVTSEHMDEATAQRAKDKLAADFPGVEFTIASRIESVIVEHDTRDPMLDRLVELKSRRRNL